jgi:hypothetical protein
MKFSKLITTTFLLGSISLGGATAWAEDVVRYSGFVDNYPDLKPDTRGGGGMLYIKPGVDIGKYNKIMIEPIEVWLADDSKYKGFSPDDLKELTDEFYRVLEANLEPDYPVVSQPGEGVLIVRLAITDVYAKKKKRGLLGYTPIGAVAGAATGAYRKVALKDATIEAELLDAVSLDQLGVLVDKLSVSKGGAEGTSWDNISKSLDYYAKRLRSRLDEER